MIIHRIALVLGALAVAAPVRAQMDVYRGVELWGGYAGYFQDPDGHLWEVVWNPQFALVD